jgi:hypothetical protein
MSCALCSSVNLAEFTAEMMIHFSGLNHLADPGVLVFPQLWVCLDCGFSQLTVPKKELALLTGEASTKRKPLTNIRARHKAAS